MGVTHRCVQVHPSTVKRNAAEDSVVDALMPLGRLLPMNHSTPVSAASLAQAADMLRQHVQPLSPFPMMGESPGGGDGCRAPQNTPAAGPALASAGSCGQYSVSPPPYAAWDAAGGARLFKEEAAVAPSVPSETPGLQDLLAAFRRAAGQERPLASPIPVQPASASHPEGGRHTNEPRAVPYAVESPSLESEPALGLERADDRDAGIVDAIRAGKQAKDYAQDAAADAMASSNSSDGESAVAEIASETEPAPSQGAASADSGPIYKFGSHEPAAPVVEAAQNAEQAAEAGKSTESDDAAGKESLQSPALGAVPQERSTAPVAFSERAVSPEHETAASEIRGSDVAAPSHQEAAHTGTENTAEKSPAAPSDALHDSSPPEATSELKWSPGKASRWAA